MILTPNDQMPMVQITMVPIMLPLAGKHWNCRHPPERRKDKPDHRGQSRLSADDAKAKLPMAATIVDRTAALRLHDTQVVRSACRDHIHDQSK